MNAPSKRKLMSVVPSAWVRLQRDGERLENGGLLATASFVVLVAIIALAAVSVSVTILYAL
jgi:hypothetical protein